MIMTVLVNPPIIVSLQLVSFLSFQNNYHIRSKVLEIHHESHGNWSILNTYAN